MLHKYFDHEGDTPMLLSFTCNNCYSFLNETTLSFRPSIKNENDHFLYDDKKTNSNFLRIAAIYGANASGKSNLIKALRDMLENMVHSHSNSLKAFNSQLKVVPYTLDSESSKAATKCKIEIYLDGLIYEYEYVATKFIVYYERLRFRDLQDSNKDNWNDLFVRNAGDKSKGEKDKYFLDEELKIFLSMIKHLTDVGSPTLYFSVVGNYLLRLRKLYNWCFNSIAKFGDGDDGELAYLAEKYNLDDNDTDEFNIPKQKLLDFVNTFDPCIKNVSIRTAERINGNPNRHIYLDHKTKNGCIKSFPLEEESSGTNRIFKLFPRIFYALDRGWLLILDELDDNLHPLVLRSLLRLFHDKNNWNKKGAQLIASCHNIVLMDQQDMRRDEIILVEKNLDGESTIYPLTSVKYEVGENFLDNDFGKAYLAGRFGGTPTINW